MSLFSLTNEELILHRYAGLVQNDLKVYHQSTSRDEGIWRQNFENHMVCLYFINLLHKLTLFF